MEIPCYTPEGSYLNFHILLIAQYGRRYIRAPMPLTTYPSCVYVQLRLTAYCLWLVHSTCRYVPGIHKPFWEAGV